MSNLYCCPIIEKPSMSGEFVEFVTIMSKFASQLWTLGAKRLPLFRVVLCFSLSFLVFAWGTNYKLSLYKAHREGSPAKVCTRGSDAAKSVLEQAVERCAMEQAPFATPLLVPLFDSTEYNRSDQLRDETSGHLLPLSQSLILHLRPPPDDQRSLT
jgi:hypothetical protein